MICRSYGSLKDIRYSINILNIQTCSENIPTPSQLLISILLKFQSKNKKQNQKLKDDIFHHEIHLHL